MSYYLVMIKRLKKKIPTKEGELIKQSKKRTSLFEGDIDDLIFQERIIERYVYPTSGLFLILPEGQRIFDALKEIIEDEIRNKLDYFPITLPKISPVDTFRKASLLGKWDDYLEKISPFSNTRGVKEDYLMEPLQCTPLYQFLEGKRLDIRQKPLKLYDASGPTYRNEDSEEIKPLIKQREFHRSEFIYLGTKEQVIQTREATLTILERVCNQLELPYRIVVGSGCYQISDEEIKFPDSEEEIPIKDLEVYLPKGFVKREETNYYLEVCGAAALGETQTRRFNIKSTEDQELWSGCVGIGLERAMYAFLANHGFNKEAWPNLIKNKYLQKYGSLKPIKVI